MTIARLVMHATGEVTVVAPFRDPKHGDGRYGFLFPDLEAARAFCLCVKLVPGAVSANPHPRGMA